MTNPAARTSDPYRHPAGRTCAGAAATIAALAVMLAALARKSGR